MQIRFNNGAEKAEMWNISVLHVVMVLGFFGSRSFSAVSKNGYLSLKVF